MIKLNNPEFHRNCWLEFSPARLLIDPILIALVVALVLNKEAFQEFIPGMATTGFAIIAILIASIKSGKSISREHSEGTWDTQRMSGLTPWQMTWGKLLGSNMNEWYDGLILLGIYSIATQDLPTILPTCAILVGLAVFFSASNMLLSTSIRAGGIRPLILFGIFIYLLFNLLFSFLFDSFGIYKKESLDTFWWGMELPNNFVAAASMLALAAWAVLGAWQAMRRELLERNQPWWWLAFLLFWTCWGAGFITDKTTSVWSTYFLYCSIISCAIIYVQLFLTSKDIQTWLRINAAWQNRDWHLILHLFPLWIVNLAYALAAFLIAAALGLAGNVTPETLFKFLALPISILAFIIRDLASILYLHVTPTIKHRDGAVLTFLLVLYFLCPLIIGLSNPLLRFAFLPAIGYNGNYGIEIFFAAITLPVLQAALAVKILFAHMSGILRPLSAKA